MNPVPRVFFNVKLTPGLEGVLSRCLGCKYLTFTYYIQNGQNDCNGRTCDIHEVPERGIIIVPFCGRSEYNSSANKDTIIADSSRYTGILLPCERGATADRPAGYVPIDDSMEDDHK